MKSELDFRTKPVLEGVKVILRPFEANDWEKMIDIISEPELRRLTGSVDSDEQANAPFPPEEVERIKEWYKLRSEQADRLDLGIVRRDNGELVGEVVFNEFDESTLNVNFRILIGAAGCDQGFGTEAIKLFLDYGFIVLGLHKVELGVYSFNPRAEKVYRKNGFVLEGIQREAICYNNDYFDTKIFGMLKEDYLRAKSTERISK
ncbi:MAG: GNAT family protein [Sporolactobacillus sp.]